MTTPHFETEIKEIFDGTTRRYVFSRGVKGLVQNSRDATQVAVFLSFTDKTDSLMWEPKRVLPLLAKFDAQAAPSVDSWALTFPASVADEALRELDAVIEGRRFYA
ncbi:hypothetical protein CQ393_10710 [Stenotrophomonas sp. MYb238]|uniref:hypothetical protein n=1 Tax=Stenotrophomonas sp. MYb238 TaxID=2040281 RepID=UPI0012928C32|nr:hypothetical protein [Stenotrophomonas sp. MYb238]MQP76358.1 hypothetical protein [Stenotrophomonas sp. MYb238]